MKLRALAAGVIAAVLLGSAAGAAAREPAKEPSACTWGASSVTARMVDGQYVVGTPQTSGCTP
jgi:hypothetical protein